MSYPRSIVPLLSAVVALLGVAPVLALACDAGLVFEDRNGNGVPDAGEPGVAGVGVSDGTRIVDTDADGRFRGLAGVTAFVIKPAGHAIARDGALPRYWQAQGGGGDCRFALRAQAPATALDVLVFADPQAGREAEVDYYARSVVAAAAREPAALGLVLGDVGNDVPALYPAINAATARLDVPWLHVPGNHDLDVDASDDGGSTASYRAVYGPETYAWEEPQASFLMLDNVIHRPGARPAYVGGLREDQFAFVEAYLARASTERLLVVGAHIPWFDTAAEGGPETVRSADRARLFALLARFPHVLLLTGHRHTQRHVRHGAAQGWHGAAPLHEYNVGAASGAFWSGAPDADGMPAATMADGTPNGFATLRVEADGAYRLAWRPGRLPADDPATTAAMALHAPRVLRQGAYPAWGVYANVYMGQPDTRVEYRIGDGDWRPMRRVERADPRLVLENVRDDLADGLRGRDRSPEADLSPHLWRGALATDLPVGEHRVEVRAFDPWQGEQRAWTVYRLAATPD
ncbi:calcineurin-like phosphoesterase C-terminal domain-containing protein [Luteimonas sp. FCS-9]|uniref:calcineurin-like phosphoesterase C-terminal domain-containing protein n=1 Tax=Luteimonas sp. FCS-9 TaxID=1547516 RepID=UPI00063E8BCF|nr:calcineurin-like phosphoesterase C-terminal domain-containing protein [Luteimonas sp. FCS-9]KLJ01995.1 calcineurin phosphoesterase [Luteimonas sp. FCS-9]